MRVSTALSEAFKEPFEQLISRFVPDAESIHSERFLARSIVPHVQKLSQMFNREESDQGDALAPYWKESSNRGNLRLAYFLYFMPANLFRVASIWDELARLGFRWPSGTPLRAIELGAGPASGACGVTAGERFAPVGLPLTGTWALIEQDSANLKLGAEWAKAFSSEWLQADWGFRLFRRRIEFNGSLLPPSAPRFNLWLTSYFLNEISADADVIADSLIKTWDRHLDEEGIAILSEPALRLQSRRLLELRKALLKRAPEWLRILTPCLGHQNCGALADKEDWCHEEVSWWRPPYLARIDKMAGLDRKTLPFSYLVIAKSRRKLEEILPALAGFSEDNRYRLVSPSHNEGRDQEFFLCGQKGKCRARCNCVPDGASLNRGDLLLDAEIRGDVHASRVQTVKKIG